MLSARYWPKVLANVVASLTSGFAGSGSFNRSAAHVAAGARTPAAAVFSAALLLLLVVVAGPLLAYIPVAAMAGTLLLIGCGLIRSCGLPNVIARNRRTAAAIAAVAMLVVGVGLEMAVFCWFGVGVAMIVWGKANRRTAKPPTAYLTAGSGPVNE